MKKLNLVKSMAVVIFALAGSQVWADKSADKNEEHLLPSTAELREELTSPLTGEFSQVNETMSWGSMKEDLGGLSGNSTSMDGLPATDGSPSSYPLNNSSSSSYPSR